jgi:hypothetical protein
MARKSDRDRRAAAPARGRTLEVQLPAERDAPPSSRGKSMENSFLKEVFPGVPEKIEHIEQKLGTSPGSRHSPLSAAERASADAVAAAADRPGRGHGRFVDEVKSLIAQRQMRELHDATPETPPAVPKPSPMGRRYAELAEQPQYEAPEPHWPAAPDSPQSPLEREIIGEGPAVDHRAEDAPLFCGFFLGGASSNDCTSFWGGAPAPQSSGCFNPFNSLSDEESCGD